MKLYTSIGPNPRLVNMLLAEKGLLIQTVNVDIVGGESRREPFLSLNALGTTPTLEIAGGLSISETTAICEYFEDTDPSKPLIGENAVEKAETRMWWRRVDLLVAQPMTAGFRGAEGLGLFQDRVRCFPQASADFKLATQEGLKWFDGVLAGRQFICGDRLTVADLLLFCFVEFGALVGQDAGPELANVAAWRARMSERPSAAESLAVLKA
jgi:glutathione S-transferase